MLVKAWRVLECLETVKVNIETMRMFVKSIREQINSCESVEAVGFLQRPLENANRDFWSVLRGREFVFRVHARADTSRKSVCRGCESACRGRESACIL